MRCTMAGTHGVAQQADHAFVGGTHLVGTVDVERHPTRLALAQPRQAGGLEHDGMAQLVGRGHRLVGRVDQCGRA